MNCVCSTGHSLHCRSCGSWPLTDVLCLGDQPLANQLLPAPTPVARHPLHMVRCEHCGLVQLTDVPDPADLFGGDYAYATSASTPAVSRAATLAEHLTGFLDLGPDSLVVEPASNDGYLLSRYHQLGIGTLGIEPARNVAAATLRAGIPTLVEFLTAELGGWVADHIGSADLVHAHNVFAHVPDVNDFVAGIRALIKDEGLLVIETPWALDLARLGAFDTIYHEHCFYWTLDALRSVLGRHDLRIVGAERLPVHGGSLRVYASPTPQVHPSIVDLGDLEALEAVELADRCARLPERVDAVSWVLRSAIEDFRQHDLELAGIGAPAKATVLMNVAGFDVDYCVDTTPWKQGRWIPGVDVPIRPPHTLNARSAVAFAWNWLDALREAHPDVRLLVPFPTPRWVE